MCCTASQPTTPRCSQLAPPPSSPPPVECVVLLVKGKGVQVCALHVARAVVAHARRDAVLLEGVRGAWGRGGARRMRWRVRLRLEVTSQPAGAAGAGCGLTAAPSAAQLSALPPRLRTDDGRGHVLIGQVVGHLLGVGGCGWQMRRRRRRGRGGRGREQSSSRSRGARQRGALAAAQLRASPPRPRRSPPAARAHAAACACWPSAPRGCQAA
jgi:hypothetical protein